MCGVRGAVGAWCSVLPGVPQHGAPRSSCPCGARRGPCGARRVRAAASAASEPDVSAKTPPKGHASKHVHKAAKHHKAKGKHHQTHVSNPVPSFRVVPPHVVGKPAKHPKPRGFAVGDVLPVCAFEAVAQSLRLAGQFVDDDEVAGLWDLAGASPLGASVAAALDAASLHGLAGFRPRWKRVERPGPVHAQYELALPVAEDEAIPVDPFENLFAGLHALILGVDVPGPHAVLATPDGWWSWGELHDPWPCRIEEAWAVSWS